MLINVAITISIIVLLVLIYAATKPDSFHVERAIDIEAPREKIFALINDFHEWDAWTPYNKDPAMKKTYGGNGSGTGATYAWEGNNAVGKGEIVITDSAPYSRIAFDLHMIAPLEGRNHVVFALKTAGDTTTVTWILDDKHAYFVKVMSVFLNTDKMIGRDFETGLAKLKSVAEKGGHHAKDNQLPVVRQRSG
jgi:Polyketide cyclase / dehydrase and lipid transport